MAYTCFTRNWYKYEIKNGAKVKVPYPSARKTRKATFSTEEEARAFCTKWNEEHKPGPLSRKCEYTSHY